MERAVQVLEGEHDFGAFGSVAAGSTVRHCFRAACVTRETATGQQIDVELSASGFLRHMVRAVVGTLLIVGRGRLAAPDLEAILASGSRAGVGPNAPPHGLYLEAVHYTVPVML